MASSNPKSSGSAKCPICGRATATDYRPFCSRRCADVDLARWLSGGYAIPARADDDEDGESTEPAAGSNEDDPDQAH